MGTHTISSLRQRYWLRAVLAVLVGAAPVLAQPQAGYLATPVPAEPVPIAASTSVPTPRVRAVAPAPPVWVVESTPAATPPAPKPRGVMTTLRGLWPSRKPVPAPDLRAPAAGVAAYRPAPIAPQQATLPPLTLYGHMSSYSPTSTSTPAAGTTPIMGRTELPVLPALPTDPSIRGWSGWGAPNPTPAMQTLNAQGINTPTLANEGTLLMEPPTIAPPPRPVPAAPVSRSTVPPPPPIPAQPSYVPAQAPLVEPPVMPHAQPTGATGPILPPTGLIPASAIHTPARPAPQPVAQLGTATAPPVRRSATSPSGTKPAYGWYGYGAAQRPQTVAAKPQPQPQPVQQVQANYRPPTPVVAARAAVATQPTYQPSGQPLAPVSHQTTMASASHVMPAATTVSQPAAAATPDVNTLIRQYLEWASQGQVRNVDVTTDGPNEVTVRFRVRRPEEAEPLVNGLSALPQLRNCRVHFEVGVGS